MIKPRFKQADITKHIASRLAVMEKEILTRLHVLGLQCVQMARGYGNNDPSAFPIKYGSSPNPKPLRQRLISARDREKNPAVKPPKFGDFLDQTSNLRQSISYFIIKDGKVIDGDLGDKGVTVAHNIAQQRARNVQKGYGLVVVAGQDYAEYVEANGYDVISSAEQFAKKQMPQLLAAMKKRIKSI
ncbi:hypothetical protein [Dyadobacter sp. 676]|uniref:Uncharacterized protein n=1 Tax=Dyadobacter sp. 676 TaxID=3088362 RepID=A0AAU8FRM9_9BACT